MVMKRDSVRKNETADFWWRSTAAFFGVVVLGFAVWFLFAGSKIRLSDEGYEISKSLYAACNLQDNKRLDSVKKVMEPLALSPKEKMRFDDILQLAEEGQWKAATQRARELLQSQDSF
jgi:hypothetical protein